MAPELEKRKVRISTEERMNCCCLVSTLDKLCSILFNWPQPAHKHEENHRDGSERVGEQGGFTPGHLMLVCLPPVSCHRTNHRGGRWSK